MKDNLVHADPLPAEQQNGQLGSQVRPLTFIDMMKEVGAIGGYAYGVYHRQCGQCERDFIGDKRASSCLPCAVSNLYRHAQPSIDATIAALASPNDEGKAS